MTFSARQAPRQAWPKERDLKAALQQQAPEAAHPDLDGVVHLVAVVLDEVARLPDVDRTELLWKGSSFRGHFRRFMAERRKPHGVPVETPEDGQGTGLGKRIGFDEGVARLDGYVTSMPLESWAGPSLGAGGIERQLGIPRSTLNDWRKRRIMVGLLRGKRKLAYPLEQFVDARPMTGIADVLTVIPDERSAWLWLRQAHAALQDRTPLMVLQEGGLKDVVRAAGRDFR